MGRRLPPTIILPRRWRRSGWASVVIVLVAVIAAYDRGAFTRSAAPPVGERRQSFDWEHYHDRTFRVARIVDGDTLDLDIPDGDEPTTRVRLWGVDAPELRGDDDRLISYARHATEFARNELEAREVYVALVPRQTRDKYGRLLAYVFRERGGVLFNELVIEQGLAKAERRFPHPYLDRFLSAEKHAKKHRLGLWIE